MADYSSEEEEVPRDGIARGNTQSVQARNRTRNPMEEVLQENQLLRAELLQLRSAKRGKPYGKGLGHPGSLEDFETPMMEKNPDSFAERVDFRPKSVDLCPTTLHSGASLVELKGEGNKEDILGVDPGAITIVSGEATSMVGFTHSDDLVSELGAVSAADRAGALALLALQGQRPTEVVLKDNKGGPLQFGPNKWGKLQEYKQFCQ